MKITYLGTAAAEGVPGILCKCRVCTEARENRGRSIRTRSQALINNDLLVDFPADSNMHFIQNNIALSDIHHVLITHSHQDHFYPNEFLYLAPWYTNDANPELHVYGNNTVIRETIKNMETHKEWEECHLSEHLILHEVKAFETFKVGKYNITSLAANHKPDEDSLNYIVEDGEDVLLYAHDTGYFLETTWEACKNFKFKLVSLDCTVGNARIAGTHMGVLNIRDVVKRMMEIGCIDSSTKVILNHISHNGKVTYKELCDIVEPDGFTVSYDGMSIEII